VQLRRGSLPASPSSDSKRDEIELTFELPPSTNKLYIKRRGGGLAPSDIAKKFKSGVQKVAARNVALISSMTVGDELVYQFELILYFEKLENPKWFEKWTKDTYFVRGKNKGQLKGRAGERKAATRYKRIDYDNRIKYLQDRVAEILGIDDSQIFRGLAEKRESPHNPRAVVRIKIIDRDQFFEERRSNG
jgi:Holliday junction resolvase RusA-like endonuclease